MGFWTDLLRGRSEEQADAAEARRAVERRRSRLVYHHRMCIEQAKAEFAAGLIDADERDEALEFSLRCLRDLDAA